MHNNTIQSCKGASSTEISESKVPQNNAPSIEAYVITGIALLAIGALVGGGLLLHVNTAAGGALLTVGGGLMIGDLILRIRTFNSQKVKSEDLCPEAIVEGSSEKVSDQPEVSYQGLLIKKI